MNGALRLYYSSDHTKLKLNRKEIQFPVFYILITRSPVKGGLKMANFESAFFYGLPFLFFLFLNFKTPVKYLEKQTDLNNVCLYTKKCYNQENLKKQKCNRGRPQLSMLRN